MLYRDDIDGIMHYSINVVTDMRSINRFSSIVCEKCYRYRLHRPLCKSCPPRYIVCAAIVNKQQNSSLRGFADEDPVVGGGGGGTRGVQGIRGCAALIGRFFEKNP